MQRNTKSRDMIRLVVMMVMVIKKKMIMMMVMMRTMMIMMMKMMHMHKKPCMCVIEILYGACV